MFNRYTLDGDTSGLVADRTLNQAVRILLVGDSGSGKTSLIHSLINDEFDYDLPPKLENITIPADITPDHVPIHITDFSERDSSYYPNQLSDATDQADVVCIVYVAGDQHSLNSVSKYWIPKIRRLNDTRGSYRPIILVANKIDLLPEASLSENITAIRRIFMDVEAHIEVSALTQRNVVELFSSAQKAITYPIAPLFDIKTRTLTDQCRNVLIKIFKLNDLDQDDLLNDKELNQFQEDCFGIPLQPDALHDLKQIIKISTNDGIRNNAVTLTGFLFLHELSIDKGRRDFTWQVLRKFNYDNQLEPSIIEETTLTITTPDETTLVTTEDSYENSTIGTESFSHIMDPDDETPTSSRSVSENQSSKNNGQLMNTFDIPWLRYNHSGLLKAGFGITVTTFISFIALRYLSATKN